MLKLPPVILILSWKSHFRWMVKSQRTCNIEISITCDLQHRHTVNTCCIGALIMIGCEIVYSYTCELQPIFGPMFFSK
jgi:hypothetical protein